MHFKPGHEYEQYGEVIDWNTAKNKEALIPRKNSRK